MIAQALTAPEVQLRKVAELQAYERNPRTHSEAQVEQLCASIRRFGWTNPCLVVGNRIIAGHGRRQAALKLGLESVPCIDMVGLSEDEQRALVIADNKLALNSAWDTELLVSELTALQAADFDLLAVGFDQDEITKLLRGVEDSEEERYTRIFAAPNYEPSNAKPDIRTLLERDKATELTAGIIASNVSESEKRFLVQATERHVVFNFAKIADYYAHASPEMQDLMERNALVIIDLGKAIANGYVTVTEHVMEQYGQDYPDDDA